MAQPVVSDGPAGACEALKSVDFTTIQDAATQLTETRMVAAAGELPAHCHVRGYIAPSVGFILRLPEHPVWNGKFAEVAPGGYGGSKAIEITMTPWCDDFVRRGYACITQDTGHTGGIGLDATWAYNNLQAEFDYGIRAANVAALAGKAITQRFYEAPPRYSYFMGCSGGGKQALVQAQRYPWNFDGVIAVEPSNPTITGVVQLWNALATHDASGKPLFETEDLQLLHDAAIAKCDLMDGLKDGIIGGDPRRCEADPGVLVCKPGQTSGCLTPVQVEAARKVYGGPVTSTGRKLYFPATPGGEMGSYITGGRTGIDYKRQYWQYMGFTPDPGPSWKPRDFDFDNDWKRSYMMDAILIGSDNPDLRKLRAEGHKLMIVQGWEDSGLPGPQVTVDYYEMVERVMGGRVATQESVRLFMIPGRSHCRGGVGAAAIDMLSYMEAWVEQGRAPDMIVGAHVEGEKELAHPRLLADFVRLPKDPASAKFTRPHYPYPQQAKYKGTGDANDYRSFEPVEP
jgi:feruloyl esterase